MKKWLTGSLAFALLLGGCVPGFQKEDKVVEENKEEEGQTGIIPSFQVSEDYYKILLQSQTGESKFQPSAARGSVVTNINTRFDVTEFETGLMRLAQIEFSPDKYYFREGQTLDTETVNSWLSRKMTPEQLEEKGMEPEENVGLNPALSDEEAKSQEAHKEKPLYIAHMLEHNYYVKSEGDSVKLAGMTIGIALNSYYYYREYQEDGTFISREVEIDKKDRKKYGEQAAQEIVSRLRADEDLKDIPIMVALFEQQEKSAVIPGNFIEYSFLDKGTTNISSWESVNEKYFLFPSNEAEEAHRDDYQYFQNFKGDVEEYFPNFNGVIGTGFYRGDELTELKIEIPIQFYGKAETIGLAQYIKELIIDHFPDYIKLQISVTSVDGPEILFVREAGEKEPFVHVYE
ncbi:CamS family sex pheromone protein [Bacillus spongiae]|uniref:CamS family sex pheromone protein n=1 Tax=Bacillus spongiae TaxID=2683610 RepID=A0ABU8HEB0_9BACI